MTDFLITDIEHGLTGRLGTDERFSGALRVRGGRIAAMGDLEPEPGERIVDARGCVVMPGLVNTHHHLFQSIMKAVPRGIDAGLDQWLQAVPYTWWMHLNAENFHVSAMIGLTELALSGCTTVADHHYTFSEGYDFDPVDMLFEIAGQFGMRFVLARGGGTKGRDYFDDPTLPPAPCEPLETWLARIAEKAGRYHDPAPDAMRRMAVAPTTPTFNVEDGALREIAAEARRLGLRLHTHLSENDTYVTYTTGKYGQRPVPWLARHDWLGPDVWFAHLVKIDADEIAQLIDTGTAMAHCPQANARLGSGIAPAPAMARAGGTVSLAVDGAGATEACDMASAMYSAFTVHRAAHGAGAVRAEEVLHWATAGGAKALDLPAVGTLEVGKAADVIVVDLSAPRYMGQHDRAIGPMISAGDLNVRHSFVGGHQIVAQGRVPWLDLGTLSDDARRVTARMIEAEAARRAAF